MEIIAFEQQLLRKLWKLSWETTLGRETTGRLLGDYSGLGDYWETTGRLPIKPKATEIGAQADLILLSPYRKNPLQPTAIWEI